MNLYQNIVAFTYYKIKLRTFANVLHRGSITVLISLSQKNLPTTDCMLFRQYRNISAIYTCICIFTRKTPFSRDFFFSIYRISRTGVVFYLIHYGYLHLPLNGKCDNSKTCTVYSGPIAIISKLTINIYGAIAMQELQIELF